MSIFVLSIFLVYFAVSNESSVSAASVKCWSKENQYLNRGDKASSPYTQIEKFCKCASGSYEYKDFKAKTLVSADIAYMYSDVGENSNYATVRNDTKSQIYSVKCYSIFMNWYDTGKDYYQYVDDITPISYGSSTTWWTLWPSTTDASSSTLWPTSSGGSTTLFPTTSGPSTTFWPTTTWDTTTYWPTTSGAATTTQKTTTTTSSTQSISTTSFSTTTYLTTTSAATTTTLGETTTSTYPTTSYPGTTTTVTTTTLSVSSTIYPTTSSTNPSSTIPTTLIATTTYPTTTPTSTSYITPTTRGNDDGGSDHDRATTMPVSTSVVSTVVSSSILPDAPSTMITVITTLRRPATTTMLLDPVDETSTTQPEEALKESEDNGNMSLDNVERGEMQGKQEPDIMSSPIFMPVALAIGIFVALSGVFLVKNRKKPSLPEGETANPVPTPGSPEKSQPPKAAAPETKEEADPNAD